jgi:hypothetical protein
MLECALQ